MFRRFLRLRDSMKTKVVFDPDCNSFRRFNLVITVQPLPEAYLSRIKVTRGGQEISLGYFPIDLVYYVRKFFPETRPIKLPVYLSRFQQETSLPTVVTRCLEMQPGPEALELVEQRMRSCLEVMHKNRTGRLNIDGSVMERAMFSLFLLQSCKECLHQIMTASFVLEEPRSAAQDGSGASAAPAASSSVIPLEGLDLLIEACDDAVFEDL